MAGSASKGGKGGGGGQASNADLQDDEDTMNRQWRGKHFREWAKAKKSIIGTPIAYDKSPAPPKK